MQLLCASMCVLLFKKISHHPYCLYVVPLFGLEVDFRLRVAWCGFKSNFKCLGETDTERVYVCMSVCNNFCLCGTVWSLTKTKSARLGQIPKHTFRLET